MKQLEQILPLLPEEYARQMGEVDFRQLEEIRIRMGHPVLLRMSHRERELWPQADRQKVDDVLSRACHQSIYAYTDTISQGYVTLEGGHRMGICGFGVREGEGLRTIRSPTSLNLRIAREVPGCAKGLGQLRHSTLFLGPPGSGKTTLLRDAIRQLSDRDRQTVGLVDERGEVSAEQHLQVGCRTDVLTNVPKALGMQMLLRTMAPDWIAVDEITEPKDLEAMGQASYCGVRLLATAHGFGLEDLRSRPLYRRLLELELFRQIVILRQDKSYTLETLSGGAP